MTQEMWKKEASALPIYRPVKELGRISCGKCGYAVGRKMKYEQVRVVPEPSSAESEEFIIEVMRRWCEACGYEWDERIEAASEGLSVDMALRVRSLLP